ncbi:MAG: glycosyltransferase [Acidobacteriaceae bacterium]|nr:glycosyltransferase [Acidobacteriaceae bacterium]
MRLLLSLDWLIVLFWTWRILSAVRNLPRVPNLLDPLYAQPLPAQDTPLISVIVPASNEEADIQATLRSLLAVDSVPLEILAIDDRSTDATGAIMDRIAAAHRTLQSRSTMSVIHVTALPQGWLGKPHAMALAARQATAPWLLFTDADVLFSSDSLLRAVNFAGAANADHLVLYPTPILKTFGERMMIGIFQFFGFLGSRPWRVPDPNSRDSIGVGAFNLIRADVYRAIGGYESLRMEVVEDLRMGMAIKSAGYRQRVAAGFGLVRLRWVQGISHFIRSLTKNFFAVFRFRSLAAFLACATLLVFSLGPFAALICLRTFWAPAVLLLVMLFLFYRSLRRINGIPAAYCLTFPVAAALFIYAVARSVIVTLLFRGIRWRGTFYPLSELRNNAGPLR